MVIISLILAILPALWLVRYFVKNDKFPEPSEMIWKTFWLGVAICLPILLVVFPLVSYAEGISNAYLSGFFSAFFVAAIPEEFFKYCVLLYFCSKHKEFDEPMDGIVYGATVSLGFAALENILYVSEGGVAVALGRAFTAVPAHASFGVVMGYFLARSHFAGKPTGFFHKALLVPILLHGLYNFPLLTLIKMETGVPEGQEFSNICPVASLGLVAMFLLTFGFSLYLARKYLKEMRVEQDQTT